MARHTTRRRSDSHINSMARLLILSCTLVGCLLPAIVLSAPSTNVAANESTTVNQTAIDEATANQPAQQLSTLNLASLLDAAFQQSNIELPSDGDNGEIALPAVVQQSNASLPVVPLNTTAGRTDASTLTTSTAPSTTTTTVKPEEELIPPATVNASIAQMHKNASRRTGQIIIT